MHFMALVYFITHPEVVVDFTTEIESWDLSEKGLSRLEVMLNQSWLSNIGSLFSSEEQKAKTAATRLSQKLRIPIQYIHELGEMDRSSTGPLPPDEFSVVVDEFFHNPDRSVRGWERAVDAQHRIIAAVEQVISVAVPDTNSAVISHGGVGALLLAHLKKAVISRQFDQPAQGYYFVFDRDTYALVEDWHAIDMIL